MQYQKYLKEEWVRKIWRPTFLCYLKECGSYKKTIDKLRWPKQTPNNKWWKYKADNIPEILDYAKMFSIDKASREYWISSRSIYRYIEKFNKLTK